MFSLKTFFPKKCRPIVCLLVFSVKLIICAHFSCSCFQFFELVLQFLIFLVLIYYILLFFSLKGYIRLKCLRCMFYGLSNLIWGNLKGSVRFLLHSELHLSAEILRKEFIVLFFPERKRFSVLRGTIQVSSTQLPFFNYLSNFL